MVGAGDPVRGPHPIRASGRSVKDDSSPVRGPHPVRASGQEKEIQGGMVGKRSDGAEGARRWRVCIGYNNIPVNTGGAPKAVQVVAHSAASFSARSAQRI